MISGIVFISLGLFNFVVSIRQRMMDARQGRPRIQAINVIVLSVAFIVMGSGFLVRALGASNAASMTLVILGGVISIVSTVLTFLDVNRGMGGNR